MTPESAGLGPVAVVGTTTWGTTLALIMARRGIAVRLLARNTKETEELSAAGEHTRRLPNHRFPGSMTVTADLAAGLVGATTVLFAVPSNSLRENVRTVAPHLSGTPVIVSCCKGLEHGMAKRMTTVLQEELLPPQALRLCALSGPNLAREIVEDLPASTVIASADDGAARAAQSLLSSPTFRVYTNDDVLGTELAGALKNIIAIGAGISDGLGFGHNAKAGFVSRGIAEVTRLGVAAGAKPQTFAGIAGIGDMMATCYSPLSRNRRVGEWLSQGWPLDEVLEGLGGEVAEGVTTTPAALEMARTLNVEMPIAETTKRVLLGGLAPREAVAELMGRAPRPE